MTENEKIGLFDKWYDENYDEWAEGEEGIALREELEQAFKSGIATLEKENAELKESYCLRRCKHCEFLHENGNCLKVGGYFTAVDNKDCPILKDKVELIKENAELKKEWQEQVQKATDEGYARTLQTIQLTKAREIIREFVEWATWQGSNCPNFKSIQDKAEQFLKDNEVEK